MLSRHCCFCLSVMMLTGATTAHGGSIWAKRAQTERAPFADDVARQVGDILTIKISEDSRIDNKAKRDLSKETDRKSAFDGRLGIDTPDHSLVSYMPGLTMDATSTNDLTSKADYKDERSYVDQITVVVIDILPNQNLVVMGTRNRDIGGDKQTIEVSGIVRPSDIAFDNTVSSQKIANFRLLTRNEGVAAPYTRPGFLGRIMDVLWPW